MLYITAGDNITFRAAAAIICITCLFYSTMMRKRSRVRNRLFMMLVSFILIDSVTDIIEYALLQTNAPDTVKQFVTYFLEMVYYMTHFGIIPVFDFYIIMLCGIQYKITKVQNALIKLPFYALELMLFTNPFTDIVFVVKDNFEYGRNIGIYIAYAVSGLYLVMGLVFLMKYWITINKLKRVAMVYFMSLAIGGTLIQMLYPAIVCELLCEAIGLMGLMLMIEKDDDRTDPVTQVYNRNAFVQDVRNFFMLGRNFYTVCIRITNVDIIRKVYGHEKSDQILKMMADYLTRLDGENDVYHTSTSVFYMLFADKQEKYLESIINKISEKLDREWTVNGENVKLNSVVLGGNSPEPFDNIDDILLLSTANIDDQEKKVLVGDDLGFLIRQIEVQKAIGRGISERTFKVAYRPIYRNEENVISVAEVVLRLSDRELGEIRTTEFMTVAEKSGFTEELQAITIESVCRFLSSGADKSDMQLDFIIIPIMSVKMATRALVKQVSDNVEHFKINPSLLAFEIDEIGAAYGQFEMEYMIKSFNEMGIKLFISDYESGFLGFAQTSSYKFDGVVINVKKIFDKNSDSNSRIVLQNRTNMIRQLKKIIILAGVDDLNMYNNVKDLAMDMFCGNLFSKPISKNELQNKFWHGERVIVQDDKVERVLEDGSL